MNITPIRTPGLGDTTYLLSHDGLGILVDPQRDVSRFLDVFDEAGVKLRWILETHLHNDYVSGGREAAARTGAELVLPASAAPAYRHTPAFHLEDLGDDRLSIRPIHTPGHTPEHTSYLVLIDRWPVAVFSGGSLLVGAAGRPDLLGPERADTLARLQYGSVHRLAALPEDIGLFPTHGEGSFCTASGAGKHTSTIGEERAANPVLGYPDEDAFVAGQMAGLQPWPTYYRHMGPANLFGTAPLPDLAAPELDPEAVAALSASVTIVDARDRHRYTASHIPGSLGVELRDDFGTWVGWLVDIATPLVLVLDEGQSADEALVQLARIGFDDVRGVMRGLAGWRAAGLSLSSHRTAGLEEVRAAAVAGAQVVDVRSPGEWAEQRLDGSLHRYVPDIAAGRLDGIDPDRPAWLVCGTGYRAAIAAGLLEQQGHQPVALIDGGVPDLCATGSTDEWGAPCDPPLQLTGRP